MMYYTYHICENIYNIESNMNTMCRFSNMCNIRAPTNINNVKDVILVWSILELMLFLHHDVRSLSKKQGQTK
jgi:hypothetical protein